MWQSTHPITPRDYSTRHRDASNSWVVTYLSFCSWGTSPHAFRDHFWGIHFPTGRNLSLSSSIKRLIFVFIMAMPQYKVSNGEIWSVNGTINFSTILQHDLFCWYQGNRWCFYISKPLWPSKTILRERNGMVLIIEGIKYGNTVTERIGSECIVLRVVIS